MSERNRFGEKCKMVFFWGLNWLLPLALGARTDPLPAASKPAVIVRSAVSAIKIDGRLDEEAWHQAARIDLDCEWSPGENIPALVRTECLVAFDRSRFYVAFRCYDPQPAAIRAHLMDRDQFDTFIQDDFVYFLLDTFNDERRAFQFRVNPLGVQVDGIFTEAEHYEDFSWDAIWSAAGRVDELGYTVEIAIPFHQLRFPRGGKVQTWGFEACRSYPRSVQHRFGSHARDRNNNCLLCQSDKITGFADVSPGRNLQFSPTLTLQRSDERSTFPAGELENGKLQADAGITARWGITPNLMLNAALNPDFSQVEADAAQLDVNTRFALYYSEKRPFFLEGADYFMTPLEVVFTRTVADPFWGAKLTGKTGRSALGFFAFQDRINNLLLPANQESSSLSLDQDVFGGTVRYRHDVGSGSTLGVLYTGRAGEDYQNHVAGVDGFIRFGKNDNLTFQYLRSRTRYPDALAEENGQKTGDFDGGAFFGLYQHTTRNWSVYAVYQDLGPDFRADSGFQPRVDTRTWDGQVDYTFWGKKNGWFKKLYFWLRSYWISDHQSRLTDSRVALGGYYEGPWQSQLTLIARWNQERYHEALFDVSDLVLSFYLKPKGGVSLGVDTFLARAVDYANSLPAHSLRVGPSAEIGLGRHVNFSLTYNLERLRRSAGRVYTAHLLQGRLMYIFNTRCFLRAILQYRAVSRQPELYKEEVDAKERRFFAQLLFSYKLNPQTVLFVGYADNGLGTQEYDLTLSNRTFFLKIGYALVL